MKHTTRCLTCSHIVIPGEDGIGLIRMQNQPRYFHESPTGCRDAELSTSDLDFQFPEGREEVQSSQRFKQEKEHMVTAE